ncbi:unnamed protein product, partial [Ectocarpus sp. 13 AM-2016]
LRSLLQQAAAEGEEEEAAPEDGGGKGTSTPIPSRCSSARSSLLVAAETNGCGEEEGGGEQRGSPEGMHKVEKSFKKACRILGIDMNHFFDTILESSLGNDLDEYSVTDSAAAVAAAAAGITAPANSVVVTPCPLSSIVQASSPRVQAPEPPSTPRGP